MPQSGSVSVPVQEDWSSTEQRQGGTSSDIRAVTANTAAANSNQGARPKETSSASSGRTELQG